jgi:hypothetical protein
MQTLAMPAIVNICDEREKLGSCCRRSPSTAARGWAYAGTDLRGVALADGRDGTQLGAAFGALDSLCAGPM